MELLLFIGLILGVMFGVPLVLIIIGLVRLRKKDNSAKIFLILGFAWLIVGLGICATLLNGG